MARRRIGVHNYRQIIVRLRAGEGTRKIAQTGLACRQVVKEVKRKAQAAGWLVLCTEVPSEEQVAALFAEALVVKVPAQVSLVERHRDQIKKWMDDGVQVSTMFTALQRTCKFTGSYGSVLRFVQKLRGAPSEADAFVPVTYQPGEAVQVDFGSGPVLKHPDTGKPTRTQIFVMTLAFSRHMYAEIVWDQKIATWLRCHRHAFEFFGGLVRRVIVDNLKSAVTRACFRDPEIQRSYEQFAEAYGFLVSPCRPRVPRHKGRVEAGVKYVKNAFVPTRTFRSIGDANQQLTTWILETAGNRIHGTTRQMPLQVFAESEKCMLGPLPATAPELMVWSKGILHSNCHVTFESSYYSAPFHLLKKELQVRAGERLVTLYYDNKQVALHRRATRRGEWRTEPSHLPPTKLAYMQRTPQWCLEQAAEVGLHCETYIRRLFGESVVDHLPAVHGVLRFADTYGRRRLDDACCRANIFDNISYKAIKHILEQGLDQAPLSEDSGGQLNFLFVEGSRFSRDIGQMLSTQTKESI